MVSDPPVGTSGRFDSFFLQNVSFVDMGKLRKSFCTIVHQPGNREIYVLIPVHPTHNLNHPNPHHTSTSTTPYLSYSTIHTLFYLRDVELSLSVVISTLSWIEKKRKLSTCVSWPQIVGSSPAASFSWSISTQLPRVSASSSRTSRCHNNHYILVIIIALIYDCHRRYHHLRRRRHHHYHPGTPNVPNVRKCEWNVTIYFQHTSPALHWNLQGIFSTAGAVVVKTV